jgi:hypothetical protein
MEDRAGRCHAIAVARHTLTLTPPWATGMAMSPDGAATEPAVRDAIVIRTEGLGGVDGAPVSSGENDHRGWRARGLGTRIKTVLTGLAQRFGDLSWEGLRCFGPLAPGCGRLEERLGCGTSRGRPPAMHEEPDQNESDHEKLINQQVRSHDGSPFTAMKEDEFTAWPPAELSVAYRYTTALLNPEQVEVARCRADELERRRGLTSERDAMWSSVAKKANPRWLWHAIDHHTGKVVASVVGRRKTRSFSA